MKECSVCGKDLGDCTLTVTVGGGKPSPPLCSKCLAKSPELRRQLAKLLGLTTEPPSPRLRSPEAHRRPRPPAGRAQSEEEEG